MTDIPILTPSECAALAAIEAKMTAGEWRDDSKTASVLGPDGIEVLDYAFHADGTGITASRNNFARMLATIAELREMVNEKTHEWLFLCVQFDDMKAWKDRESATIAAHEATMVAELRKELEERK